MRQGIPDPRGLLRLTRQIAARRPHLVQTWLYHADLLGGLAAKAAGNRPVFWNIRNGTLEPGASRRSTVLTVRACAWLSRRLPDRIVCCAETARDIHIRFGYAAERMCVIPNGFDIEAFRPDPAARLAVRQELGLPATATLVGLFARFHPQKDHRGFVQAAMLLRREHPDVQFVLCGDGIDGDNGELAGWLAAAGLREGVFLLGRRQDLPRLTAALDLAVSASACGEAFSNTLGEAMACGIPCVATRVGDAALIVGDTGRVVEPNRPDRLAAAMGELLAAGPGARADLGRRARQRIEERFSLAAVVRRYEALYEDYLPGPTPSLRPRCGRHDRGLSAACGRKG